LQGTYSAAGRGIAFDVLAQKALSILLSSAGGEELERLQMTSGSYTSTVLGGRLRIRYGVSKTTSDPMEIADGDFNALHDLVARPEMALLAGLSEALGDRGFDGAHSRAAAALHEYIASAGALSGRIAQGRSTTQSAPAGLHLQGTSGSFSVSACYDGPAIGTCEDLRSDPHHNGANGMCGPGQCCVEQVCGDCCNHPGCLFHDLLCGQCPKPYQDYNTAFAILLKGHVPYGCTCLDPAEMAEAFYQGGGCGASDTSSCPYGDGLYCGSRFGRESNWLYSCNSGLVPGAGGYLTRQVDCGGDCQLRTDTTPTRVGPVVTGIHDGCPAPSGSSSATQCSDGDGMYCGGHGVDGDPNALFQCSGGTATFVTDCPGGCQVNSSLQNDQCVTGSGVASGPCPYGDGLYCGGNGVDGDPNTLFQCVAGVRAVVEMCPSGCQAMPAGVNDECVGGSGPCTNGNGLYCGGDVVPGDSKTLYQCTDGYLSVVQVCPGGCQVMPAGVDDQCLPPSDGGTDGAADATTSGGGSGGNFTP
jgi:hypothetical protein